MVVYTFSFSFLNNTDEDKAKCGLCTPTEWIFRSSEDNDDDDEHRRQKLIRLRQNFSSTFSHFLFYRAAAPRTSDLRNDVGNLKNWQRGNTRGAVHANAQRQNNGKCHFVLNRTEIIFGPLMFWWTWWLGPRGMTSPRVKYLHGRCFCQAGDIF